MKSSYTYTILRYCHDTATGEFVNAGVVLYAPECRFAGARCRKTLGRVSKVFPEVDGPVFRSLMKHIEGEICKYGTRLREELEFDHPPVSAMDIARSVLPVDDSSLQWSPPGSGLTEHPEKTLESLFERFVTRYDERPERSSRDDEAVWRGYKRTLETRNVLGYLTEKRIAVEGDEVTFEHAWKNGVWHCLEPLSFDLASRESIREKAHRWLGHITSVKDAADDFKVYFLLGEPHDKSLRDAVENAIGILGKIPMETEIVREGDAEVFSRHFADEVERHSIATKSVREKTKLGRR